MAEMQPKTVLPVYRADWLLIFLSGSIALSACLIADFAAMSVLAVGSLALYLMLISIKSRGFVFKYAVFLFACAANVVGCVSIELLDSTYLNELRCYSSFVGSLPLLCAGWWLFFTVIYLIDCRFEKRLASKASVEFSRKDQSALPVFTVFVAILALVMFINVLPNPSFLLGVDRFVYNSRYIGGIWASFAAYMPFLIVVPILSIREGKGRIDRTIGILAVVFYFLYLFWTGTKFGDYFTVLCLVLLVYYDKIMSFSEQQMRKLLGLVAFSLCVLLCFTGFAHSFTSSNSAGDFYGSRTAQQGQIWWAMYKVTDGGMHLDDFADTEIDALLNNDSISESVGEMHGIYRAMYLTAPTHVVDSKLSSGSRYTEAGFACSYYYFGVLGVAAFAGLMG